MFNWFFVRPYIYSTIFLAVIAGVYFAFFASGGGSEIETITVARGDVVNEISITGKVKASESVELGFDRSGRIIRVGASVGRNVRAGEVLAQIYAGDLSSQLAEVQASLKSEEAKLEELKRGSRQEDIDIAKAKAEDAKRNLDDKIQDSYTNADDAIRNKIDQFFSNPRTNNPQLTISINPQLESDIETGRIIIESKLKAWASSLAKMEVGSNLYPFAGESDEHLKYAKSFLDAVALGVNSLTPNSSISQATIDSYKADVSTARTNINAAINGLSSAVSDLKISESELSKTLAGSTPQEILVAEANVEKARASANKIRADISKTILTSPINGVVTKQDAKVGQIILSSTPVVSIISESEFEVEANLPEADVGKIKVGNDASLTLDAYGSGIIFGARVVAVDPAETVIEGISTYKITVAFVEKDSRVKSGLTANVDILGAKKENVLFVPQRAIIARDGKKFVRMQNPDGRADEVEIEVGLTGSDGRVEVLSGISEGTVVIVSRESA